MKIHINHIRTIDSVIENLIAGEIAGLVIDLYFPSLGWIIRLELVAGVLALYFGSNYLKNLGGN